MNSKLLKRVVNCSIGCFVLICLSPVLAYEYIPAYAQGDQSYTEEDTVPAYLPQVTRTDS